MQQITPTKNTSNVIKQTEIAQKKAKNRLVGSIFLLLVALCTLLYITAKIKPVNHKPAIVMVEDSESASSSLSAKPLVEQPLESAPAPTPAQTEAHVNQQSISANTESSIQTHQQTTTSDRQSQVTDNNHQTIHVIQSPNSSVISTTSNATANATSNTIAKATTSTANNTDITNNTVNATNDTTSHTTLTTQSITVPTHTAIQKHIITHKSSPSDILNGGAINSERYSYTIVVHTNLAMAHVIKTYLAKNSGLKHNNITLKIDRSQSINNSHDGSSTHKDVNNTSAAKNTNGNNNNRFINATLIIGLLSDHHQAVKLNEEIHRLAKNQ